MRLMSCPDCGEVKNAIRARYSGGRIGVICGNCGVSERPHLPHPATASIAVPSVPGVRREVWASLGGPADPVNPDGRKTWVVVVNETGDLEAEAAVLAALRDTLWQLAPGTREPLLARWEANGGLRLSLEAALDWNGLKASALTTPGGAYMRLAPSAFNVGRVGLTHLVAHEVAHLSGIVNEDQADIVADRIEAAVRRIQ